MDRFSISDLVYSSILSFANAAVITASLSCSTLIMLFILFVANERMKICIAVFIESLESIPIYIWVLVGISWAPKNQFIVVLIIFIVAGLPLTYGILRHNLERIRNTPYVDATKNVGTRQLRLFIVHVLPNLIPVATPVFISTLGSALAINACVGIFGFVNREARDLGVLILIAKEQAAFDVSKIFLVLMSILSLYTVIYIFIYNMKKHDPDKRPNNIELGD